MADEWPFDECDAQHVRDHKREPKYTQKALEEKFNRLLGQRRGKMAQITPKMKEIENMKNTRAY